MITYFAWADADEPFGPEHHVFDEDVLSWEVSHAEGDFARLVIELKNPRVGLLAAGRKTWAYLAVDDGLTDGVTPIFYGRLVAIPDELQAETVQLVFIARPADYEARQATVVNTLKVLPGYDPLWIAADRRNDPDAVLEGWPKRYHIDRVDHTVSASDILNGEDGTISLDGSDELYESMDTAYGDAPGRRIEVSAQASWRQAVRGTLDLTAALEAAARVAGTTVPYAITSLTGEGLVEDWPEKGDNIGAGWKVGESSVVRTDGLVGPQLFMTTAIGGGSKQANFPLWTLKPVFKADYAVERRYSETVRFSITADIQAVVNDDDGLLPPLNLSSSDADQPIDPADTDHPRGTMPIGDVRKRSYFHSTRGRQSLVNLIYLARTRLLAASRAVNISIEVPFETGLAFSCRKNLSIEDDRLPGGIAAGKIIAYSLSTGSTREGEAVARVTIGCTVGKGGTVSVVDGTPSYVEEGYVDVGYQLYDGQTIMPIAGEITFADFSGQLPDDDGLDFFNLLPADVIDEILVFGGETEQRAVLDAFTEPTFTGFTDLKAAANAVNQVFTEIDVKLVSLKVPEDRNGVFATDYAVTVSVLKIPATIDLEAA